MNKICKTLLVIITFLSLASCTSTQNVDLDINETDETQLGKADIDLSNAEGKLKEILDKGVLVVATSPDYPPNEYIDMYTGEVKGSEMTLAKYIANSLGVTLQVETMDFSAVLTAVDTGKADIAISGFGYKADRAKNYELSKGYQGTSEAACHTLLVFTDEVGNYNSLNDFSGKKIDAQASSLQEMYVTDEIPAAELTLVSTLDQAILELNSKKVDAVALDCNTAEKYAEQSNGTLSKSNVDFDLTPYADYAGNVIAAKKGETALINTINDIIEDVKEKDLYADWYAQAKAEADAEEKAKEAGNTLWGVWTQYWPIFMKGLVGTLKYAFIAVFFGSIIGAFVALLHLSKNKVLSSIAAVYVNVLRGTPLLVQMYIVYFFFPLAFPALNALSKDLCVVVSLVLNSSAYVSEIFRGGIESVDIGQTEAARSLGMSKKNCMVKIIFPQAIKAILPSLGNEYISMIKETSLAGTFMLYELMYTKTLLANKFLIWQPMIIIAIIYLICTMVLSFLVKQMEKRLSVSD